MASLKLTPFKEAGLSIQDYKTIKEFNLRKCKGFCGFCKQKFNKYLYLVPKSKTQNITHQNSMIACRICYHIYNFSGLYINDYVIAYSEMDQEKIIAKTVSYIRENEKVPSIENIDEDAYKVNLSILEYFDLVRSYENLKGDLSNIKVFVDLNFDLSFMGYKKEVFGFTEEKVEEFDEYNKKEQSFDKLLLKEFNKDTINFLEKHFNSSDDSIKKTIFDLDKTKSTLKHRLSKLKNI